MKVKICGIRTIEAAIAAVEAGADFLGFNFVPTSRRRIEVDIARQIAKEVKEKIYIVGVFQNQDIEKIEDIVEYVGLGFVQLHGDESPAYVEQVKTKVIKVFNSKTINTMSRYSDCMYLLDRDKQGEGEMIDLEKARVTAKKFSLFLAGGLTPENVKDAIEKVRPYAVDVASGVETNGEQDLEKIKLFIERAKVL
ncbi:MAG: phosphoribosylanthranilate isomerase [Candidatus Levybacteria bacterium]|nr:phosphoribosylanthranilate isomerase [Candidatus Levybacteria bacterium]